MRRRELKLPFAGRPQGGPRVAVIGAGLGGIATAVKLKKAGFDDFSVIERSAGPGGTWWDNTYPGCEVDVPSRSFSYSFMSSYDWTRNFAGQRELQKYIEEVIDRFGLRPHLRLNTAVTRVEWNDDEARYDLHLATGDVEPYNLVVAAVGMFSEPNYPTWPGLDEFQGPKFHTARWEHEHDLSDKRVAVVGTGSTAAQVIPELAKSVRELLVYQRQPGWVLPKGARDYTAQERAKYRRLPLLGKWERLRWNIEERRVETDGFEVGSKYNAELLRLSREFLHEEITDPELRASLTPDYPWGCKRIVIASDFYKALTRPNVTLVPHAVERVTPTGLVSDDGEEREVDVLVMSTGFRPYAALNQLPVTGPGGVALQDLWAGDPRGFLGITVAGIPNFFMLYGPNTNGPPAIGMLEQQADFVTRIARRMRRTNAAVVDTPKSAMDHWVTWIDGRNHKLQSAGFAGCTNYYFAPGGRNVTQWPSSWVQYAALTRLLSRFVTFDRGA